MIYTLSQIKEKTVPVCRAWGVTRLLLIGSYARGEATEDSDVDLVVFDEKNNLSGSRFYALVEDLRSAFQPHRVEVMESSEMSQMPWMATDTLRQGVALYES